MLAVVHLLHFHVDIPEWTADALIVYLLTGTGMTVLFKIIAPNIYPVGEPGFGVAMTALWPVLTSHFAFTEKGKRLANSTYALGVIIGGFLLQSSAFLILLAWNYLIS